MARSEWTSLSRALWQAENATDQALDVAMLPLGLSTSLFGTLRLIAANPGRSAADLARDAGVRPQSTAYAVSRLEELGMVERRPHPVHGKVMQVFPTRAGDAALTAGDRILRSAEKRLTAAFTSDQLRVFHALLARITENARQILANQE